MSVPGAPPPAGVQQFFQVVAHTGAERLHRRGRRKRNVGGLAWIGIHQAVEQGKLRAPGRTAAGGLGAPAASIVAHGADRNFKEPISSHVLGSSPTTSVTAPSPRMGPLSPT